MMLRRRGAFVSRPGNAPVPNPPPQPEPTGQLLFSDNMEGTTALQGWNRQNGGTAYALQHTDSPTSGKALRFELRAGDPENNNGVRSEVIYSGFSQAEGWYAFRAYFPSDGYPDETGTSREIISQWHQGGGSGSPYCIFVVEQGKLKMHLNNDAGIDIKQVLGAQTKDQWHTFIFHTRFSSGSDGFFRIYWNGSKVFDNAGPNLKTGFPLPEWKIGLYKWDWNDGATTTTDKRVLWVDDVKIGNQDATYNQMAGVT